VLLVTHDERHAKRMPRQIRMFNGRIVEDGGQPTC
jgi:predicted ABC-type transport system involved in lysophospholipase L1 biosynthesis ATPase subunit